ncbi:hypothetical protein NSQ24_06350 [Brevibacillus sp. FSL L8-0520]|uniref:hypothetical protein n=1 Tax=Brevibacillus sp. FSL L8-0520 TaxID=2954689 RepID=UPI0030CEBA7F
MAEKTRQYLFLFVALLFALLAVFYYIYLTPLQAKKSKLTVELAQLQATVQGLSSRNAEEKKDDAVSEEALAKVTEAIPVSPYTDQLVKDLGKLQTISKVEILTASFAQPKVLSTKDMAEQIISKEEQGADTAAEESTGAKEPKTNSDTDKKETGTAEATGIASEPNAKDRSAALAMPTADTLRRLLPETALGSVEITLSVKGGYDELYLFLKEVQGLSRYLRVDEFTVTAAEKDEFTVPKDSRMTATIKLTSYYAPEFKQAVDKLPAVEVEAPSGKGNPFQYGITPKPGDPINESKEGSPY